MQDTSQRRKEYQRRYYLKNKDRFREANFRRLYGISLQDYAEMLTVQASGCAICGHIPGSGEKRLHVDHNHETGEVRGLLCKLCNVLLGQSGESEEVLEGCIEYLRRYGNPDPSRSGMDGRARDYSILSRPENEAARVRGVVWFPELL